MYWKPVDYLKSIWETFDTNVVYIAKLNCGSDYVAIIQKYYTHMYGSAIIFGYLGKFTYVALKEGVWLNSIDLYP